MVGIYIYMLYPTFIGGLPMMCLLLPSGSSSACELEAMAHLVRNELAIKNGDFPWQTVKFAAVQLPSPIHEFWNHQQRVPGIACYARSLWHCPKHAEDSAGLQVFAGEHGCHRQTKLSIVLSLICYIPIDNNCCILYIYIMKKYSWLYVLFFSIYSNVHLNFARYPSC